MILSHVDADALALLCAGFYLLVIIVVVVSFVRWLRTSKHKHSYRFRAGMASPKAIDRSLSCREKGNTAMASRLYQVLKQIQAENARMDPNVVAALRAEYARIGDLAMRGKIDPRASRFQSWVEADQLTEEDNENDQGHLRGVEL